MIHPTNSHLPVLNSMKKQPGVAPHCLKISFDQLLVDNMVMAEKMSEM